MSWNSYNQIELLKVFYRSSLSSPDSSSSHFKKQRVAPSTAAKDVEAPSSSAVTNFLYMNVDKFIQNIETFFGNMVFRFSLAMKKEEPLSNEEREKGYWRTIKSPEIIDGRYIVEIGNSLEVHVFEEDKNTAFENWVHIRKEGNTIVVPRNTNPDQNKWTESEENTVEIVYRDKIYSIDKFLLTHKYSSSSTLVVESPKLLMDVIKSFFNLVHPDKELHVEDKSRSSRVVGDVKYTSNMRRIFELLLVNCSTVYKNYGFKPRDEEYEFSLSDAKTITINVKHGLIYLNIFTYELQQFLDIFIRPTLASFGALPAFWFIEDDNFADRESLAKFIETKSLTHLSESNILTLKEV